MEKIKLFCFPYAGGSATIYDCWRSYLHTNIELCPIELAGRGIRIGDLMYRSINEAVENVYEIIKENLNSDYALFGHSMGGAIVFNLAQKIGENKLREPKHIFFSGRGAPNLERDDKIKYHLLNENKFEHEVLKLGGTPHEIFKNPELKELFIPLLRNDFKLVENWKFGSDINPFNCNISIFLGKEEDVSPEEVDAWKCHTKHVCSIHYFNGGHFFLHNEFQKIVKFINMSLIESCQV